MKRNTLAPTTILALLLISTIGTQFSYIVAANPHPWNTLFVQEGDVSPPSLAKPPEILLLSPQNNSLHTADSINFTLNVSLSIESLIYHFGDLSFTYASAQLDEVFYETDWVTNNTYIEPTPTISLNLTGIPDGKHSIVVYAVEWRPYQSRYDDGNDVMYYNGFKITGSSTVCFAVDTVSPNISILSLKNTTYSDSDIPLTFTVSEPTSEISCVLDGKKNMTINGNTTLSGLSNGAHNVTVFAKDAAENSGASETITFTITQPFPTTLVAAASGASVAIIGIGLLVYFRKRKH
jgi:hypothetical protein